MKPLQPKHPIPGLVNLFGKINFLGIAFLLYLLVVTTLANAQIKTPWQMHLGAGPQITGFISDSYGDSTEYILEAIPSQNDTGWKPAPDPGVVGYFKKTECELNLNCRRWVDYTYFQTFVSYPVNMVLSTFTIRFKGIDDGVHVTVYNSTYPNGYAIPRTFVKLGDGGNKFNLIPFANPCEPNRFVVTHVDDCCLISALDSAYIELKGLVTNTSVASAVSTPVLCGTSNTGTATASSSATGPFTYYWNSNPIQTTATATGLSVGTYICTVKPAIGCESAVEINVANEPPIAVSIVKPSALTINTCSYGQTSNIILGYPGAPQQLTISSNRSGGVAPYTYSWSGSGSQLLSSKTTRNPVFNPSNQSNECKTYKLVLTVRDARGCTNSDSAEVKVVKATASSSQSCGSSTKKKILICHIPPGNNSNPQTLSISTSALASHTFGPTVGPSQTTSAHKFDCIGSCGVQCSSSSRFGNSDTEIIDIEAENQSVELFPNPNNGRFFIAFYSEVNAKISFSITNLIGETVAHQNFEAMQTGYNVVEENITDKISSSGFYFIHFQGANNESYVTKFSVIKD